MTSNVGVSYSFGGIVAALVFLWPVSRKEAIVMCVTAALTSYVLRGIAGFVGGFIGGYRKARMGRHHETMAAFHDAVNDVVKDGRDSEPPPPRQA